MQHRSAGLWVMVVHSKEELITASGPPWGGKREKEVDVGEEPPSMEVPWW